MKFVIAVVILAVGVSSETNGTACIQDSDCGENGCCLSSAFFESECILGGECMLKKSKRYAFLGGRCKDCPEGLTCIQPKNATGKSWKGICQAESETSGQDTESD